MSMFDLSEILAESFIWKAINLLSTDHIRERKWKTRNGRSVGLTLKGLSEKSPLSENKELHEELRKEELIVGGKVIKPKVYLQFSNL